MNETVNKILLVGDKFLPEMHLKQFGFSFNASGSLKEKTKKQLKSLCKLERQTLCIKMSLIKLVFNMIWLFENQKI